MVIEERAGSDAADYSIRALQSKHKLVQAVPVKDPSTGSTTSSYWDLEIGGVSSAAGTGVTHAELGDLATFSGWDFATVWQLDGATRPYLRWYPLPVAPVCGDALLDFVEACDDGNTIDGDGCAADCLSF